MPGAPAGKRGYISNKILQATQSGSESPSRVSHSMIVSRGGTFDEVYVIEQTFPHMREVKLSEHYQNAFIVAYRSLYAPLSTITNLLTELRQRVLNKELYAVGVILLLFLDSVLCDIASWIKAKPVEVRFFTRIKITSLRVCSGLTSEAFYKYCGLFDSNPDQWTPDDQDDHCKNSADWHCIGEFQNGKRSDQTPC